MLQCGLFLYILSNVVTCIVSKLGSLSRTCQFVHWDIRGHASGVWDTVTLQQFCHGGILAREDLFEIDIINSIDSFLLSVTYSMVWDCHSRPKVYNFEPVGHCRR